jgi:hypothetical protein
MQWSDCLVYPCDYIFIFTIRRWFKKVGSEGVEKITLNENPNLNVHFPEQNKS